MAKKLNNKILDELASIENQFKSEVDNNDESVDVVEQENNIEHAQTKRSNMLDGYVRVQRHNLPQAGILYPESWEFAIKTPTAKEIANFSTINEQDQPGIIVAVEDLIRKCVVIFDTDINKQINSGEIADAHRTFFLLKIREQYLSNKPVTYRSVCQTCHESFDVKLEADKLSYPMLNDKLISAYDGRMFELNMSEDITVKFRIPTIETTGRIFKYIIKVYRNNAQNSEENKSDNVVFDKQFLLLAPYLYETGKETIRDIMFKFKAVQKNNELFNAYLTIVNRLKIDNSETFEETCTSCGSLEETQLRFPGGFKKLFIDTRDTTGYFD